MAQSPNNTTPNPPTPVVETEHERLRRDVFRSDKEKFQLLVEMFHRNAMLKKAKITHKP